MVIIQKIKMTPEEAKILGDFTILEPDKVMVKNPFSGEGIELEPEAVAIYDIIKGCEVSLSSGYVMISRDGIASKEEMIDMFHAARDVFRRNWPKEYMLLVD